MEDGWERFKRLYNVAVMDPKAEEAILSKASESSLPLLPSRLLRRVPTASLHASAEAIAVDMGPLSPQGALRAHGSEHL